MKRPKVSIAAVLVAACALPATLRAQEQEPSREGAPAARFQFGPLGLTPRFAIKDLGVDSNPLNEPGTPEGDVTATVVPGVDSWLRVGRGLLSAKTNVEWLYFNKSRTQRSVNLNQDARAELFLNRLIPFVSGQYMRTRRRPNLEIDQRVQQKTVDGGAGVSLLVGARTQFDFEVGQTDYEFGEGRHGDVQIANALNRKAARGGLVARYRLTPLTKFVVRTEMQRDRFDFETVRNANSLTILPGLELKPSALISGKVFVGFRRFDVIDPTVPDFSGLVGQIDAQYIWRESTLFNLRAVRMIEFSIEDQPYFVANGGVLTVKQIIGLNWYVAARGGRTRLAYRDFIFPSSTLADDGIGRSDRFDTYGVGIGRRIGAVTVGFDVDHVSRRSTLKDRQYDGYRLGGSISYGF